ncbi:MAG TPA: hypothetical protein VE871_05485 [Longimicrobium sp.]|nr:hypothetical protein [Longimicrobium sp.]
MRTKLTLNLEDLTVDSFDTTRPAARQGTVFGEQCTCYTNCTCAGAECDRCVGDTCPNSCVGSCPCGTYPSECNWLATCLETECSGSPCCR